MFLAVLVVVWLIDLAVADFNKIYRPESTNAGVCG